LIEIGLCLGQELRAQMQPDYGRLLAEGTLVQLLENGKVCFEISFEHWDDVLEQLGEALYLGLLVSTECL
jgi:hypothetical protein